MSGSGNTASSDALTTSAKVPGVRVPIPCGPPDTYASVPAGWTADSSTVPAAVPPGNSGGGGTPWDLACGDLDVDRRHLCGCEGDQRPALFGLGIRDIDDGERRLGPDRGQLDGIWHLVRLPPPRAHQQRGEFGAGEEMELAGHLGQPGGLRQLDQTAGGESVTMDLAGPERVAVQDHRAGDGV